MVRPVGRTSSRYRDQIENVNLIQNFPVKNSEVVGAQKRDCRSARRSPEGPDSDHQLRYLKPLPDDLEHARRACLVQLVSRRSTLGCTLVVYERREDNKVRNADSALFSQAARNGFVPRNIRIFPGSPSAGELLWGPDLAGWALRRYVAMNDVAWVLPLIGPCEVIDVSLGMTLTTKRAQPAAAMGSGPDPSVGPAGEGMESSSP